MVSLALAWAMQSDSSTYTLPIGRSGQTVVAPGRITDLKNGNAATSDDVAKAADRKLFVFLGEQHATAPDQLMHADIIQALVRRGRHVVVGMEMYQRPKQAILDQWSRGKLGEDEFVQQSDWKGQWGYDFGFYRPIFDTVQRFHLPLIGLNVPHDWVRSVGRGGYAALTAEQKAQLPNAMSLDNKDHHAVFDSLMGGHPMTGTMGDNIYAAQVLWDEGMADTALKYLEAHKPDSRTVFVVIAGAGHVMYRQGINYRIDKRHGGDGITVVMTESKGPMPVSNGLADFVFVSEPAPPGRS